MVASTLVFEDGIESEADKDVLLSLLCTNVEGKSKSQYQQEVLGSNWVVDVVSIFAEFIVFLNTDKEAFTGSFVEVLGLSSK